MKSTQKTTRIRAILQVKNKTYLSPHYIRVTLTGDEVSLFKDTVVGRNNKIFLPCPETKQIHFDGSKSIRRTYTHRGIDLVQNEMYIDFVAHGERGPGSAWAIHAKPGDTLGVAMKSTTEPLHPKADWYLLVADATGIPVIATILERLPAHAAGVAYLEVLNEQEEIPIQTTSAIQIHWIHHARPGKKSPLAKQVQQTKFPKQKKQKQFGYVVGESAMVKAVREYLMEEKTWKKDALYSHAYWKYGKKEGNS